MYVHVYLTLVITYDFLSTRVVLAVINMIVYLLCLQWGYLVIALEWLCFTCTHSLGSAWKASFIDVPFYVKLVMANSKYMYCRFDH